MKDGKMGTFERVLFGAIAAASAYVSISIHWWVRKESLCCLQLAWALFPECF